jgi:hypothetical protein
MHEQRREWSKEYRADYHFIVVFLKKWTQKVSDHLSELTLLRLGNETYYVIDDVIY